MLRARWCSSPRRRCRRCRWRQRAAARAWQQPTLRARASPKIQILAIAAVVALLPLTAAAQNHFFAATASNPARLASFKMKLVDQICEASGGPCKYTGKDMKTAHQGMGISTGDFNALVEDLVGALDKFKVGAAEKNQLLGVLGPMQGQIVEKR
ncbi:MAG: hypothetical protein DMF88_02220 [Acidobacteria bacterium]|nr:MAG: hypothetical protein DMF88_02220 [Acidobacteriota bacterium]